MKSLLAFAFSISVFAQTVPVEVSVNWPPPQIIYQKYGPIPKWAVFGEIIGCNKGDSAITFGEGDVISALRKSDSNGGLQAFSRQDAISLVGNSQSASKKNIVIAWLKAGAKSAVDAKATGLIGGSSITGVGVVLGAELIDIVLPNAITALNLRQVITYSQDGLQGVMAVSAGRCTPPASLLFAVPGPTPKQPDKQPIVFTVQVPVVK